MSLSEQSVGQINAATDKNKSLQATPQTTDGIASDETGSNGSAENNNTSPINEINGGSYHHNMSSTKLIKQQESLGVVIPKVLIPARNKVNFTKWATIACDQFTSEPEYWKDIEKNIVKDGYSALNLIYPEVYLEENRDDYYTGKINTAMKKYQDLNLFNGFEGLVLLERQTPYIKRRKGLVLALDLEKYEYRGEVKVAEQRTL